MKEKKLPKLGTENALFGYFWAGILKKSIDVFEINTLAIVKNEFLIHTVNFGIGPAFSVGPLVSFF